MSAALAVVVDTRRCPRCDSQHPATVFTTWSAYCPDCRRSYQRERKAAIVRGTWVPRSERIRVIVPAPLGVEDQLLASMIAYYGEHGFTALTRTLERLRARVAQRNRAALMREGWVA